MWSLYYTDNRLFIVEFCNVKIFRFEVPCLDLKSRLRYSVDMEQYCRGAETTVLVPPALFLLTRRVRQPHENETEGTVRYR